MAKSAVSTNSRIQKHHQRSNTGDSGGLSNTPENDELSRSSQNQSNFMYNPPRQDSISTLLNNYLTSNASAPPQPSTSSSYALNSKENRSIQSNPAVDTNYPSYYLNTRDTTLNIPISTPQHQTNNPIMRPRGDSIFLPPPINSQLRLTNIDPNYENTIPTASGNAGNNFPSRSNSIFSSLIQIPGSSGNSISEKGTTNSNSAGGVPSNRQRQQSIFPSGQDQISIEDLENILNKESLGNLLAWSQQHQQSQELKQSTSNAPTRSKFGSLDLSMWNDGLNNSNNNNNNNNNTNNNNTNTSTNNSINLNGLQGSISGFNGSLTDFIAGMISNGSIDLSNMSNEQRRDSILKIINDLQNVRQQRIPSDGSNNSGRNRFSASSNQSGKTMLREDIFDDKSASGRTANQGNNTVTESEQPNNPNKYNLAVPIEKTHLSPASSMSSRSSVKYNDEPQSPKTSPSVYHARMNQQQAPTQYQGHQQPIYPQQQSHLPQPAVPSQRLFQNYQTMGVPSQFAYPNAPAAHYDNSLPPNVTIRNTSTQQQQPNFMDQQQNYQQFSPQVYQPNTTQGHRKETGSEQSNQSSKQRKTRQRSTRGSASDKEINENDPNDKSNLVSAQLYVKSEDGRPLLGATKIDQLMLVIQARDKGITNQIQQAPDGSILGSPNFSLSRDKDDMDTGVLPRPVSLVGGVDKPSKIKAFGSPGIGVKRDLEDGEIGPDDSRLKTKKHKSQQCPYCFKYFTQSTHLEVHIRSHIGFKPFECHFCQKRFTQGGNLRTHMRLHTGEKPFTCEICNRSFSRKGNLAAHKLTHENLKPYECKLDGCDKSFTQLGNLKSHQNRFHLSTLNKLTHKLAELSGPAINNLPKEEKELLVYFKDLYKNSNKGIRGRGKQKVKPEESAAGIIATSPPGELTNSRGQFISPDQRLQALPRQNQLQEQQYTQQNPQQPLDFMNTGYRDSNQIGGPLNGYRSQGN